MIQTTVRCFRRLQDEPCDTRRGVWLMTESMGSRGVFFHGDYKEALPPYYTVQQLSKWSKSQGEGFLDVQEITPDEALKELETWPEVQKEAIVIFNRHPIKGKPK